MIKIKIPFPLIDIYFFKWNNINKNIGIHNHAKNGCFMFVLQGKLKELIYSKNLDFLNEKKINRFNYSYISDEKGYHDIIPLKKSYSIHFYYPKNHKTKYFLY